jgi:hypothetical protein
MCIPACTPLNVRSMRAIVGWRRPGHTFLISGWLAHAPSKVLSQNFNIPESALSVLPEQGLYIFPGTVPGPLEEDQRAVGGAFENRKAP